jgi:uncharacterized protein (DUF4415 family)
MKPTSQTDWNRVDALTDEAIDTSDIPPLDDQFFRRAQIRIPNATVPVTIHMEADVLAWFRAQGPDLGSD